MSAWWRLRVSGFLHMDSVVAWIKQIIPEEFAFGNKIPTEQIVCGLLETFQQDRFLLSLDYSKAYDRLRPEVCVGMLEHLGWPPGLTSVLQHVWGRQSCWVHWGGSMPIRFESPALPQGDPGPVYLLLSHHQPFVRGNFHTTYFHRQLAVDHANHNNIPLPGNFHVHHTNGRKYDNHISNLEILTPQQHHQRHQQQPPRPKPKPKPKPFHRRRVRRQ